MRSGLELMVLVGVTVTLTLSLSLAQAQPRYQLASDLPSHLQLPTGHNLTLQCAARMESRSTSTGTNSNKKPRLRWLKDGIALERNNRTNIRKYQTNGTYFSKLQVIQLQLADRGNYTCLLNDTNSTVSLTVLPALPPPPPSPPVSPDTRPPPALQTLTPPSFDSDYASALPAGVTRFFLPIETEIFQPDIPPSSSTLEIPEPTYLYTTADTQIEHKNSSIRDTPPLCQTYDGTLCAAYLVDQYVYIPYPETQAIMEEKLKTAFKVVSYSNEISTNCEKYALPSLCFSTFPVCRTPEVTNELFYRHLQEFEDGRRNPTNPKKFKSIESSGYEFAPFPVGGRSYSDPSARSSGGQLSQTEFIRYPEEIESKSKRDLEYRIDAESKAVREEKIPEFQKRTQSKAKKFSLTRDAVPLRRVCRDDCEILENELCQEEYAIAKRHPEIGQKLTLEDCVDLPADSPDCLEIGIEKFIGSEEECYWESGLFYRGVENVAASGLPCVKWSHQFKVKINENLELSGGHNYCRNPGGTEPQPWCFVEKGPKIEKQLCEIPKCSQKIWIYIIVTIIILIAVFLTCVSCCCHYQNTKNNTTAIRNINLPNADKNIYGNSRLNSPIELSEMLNQNSSAGASGSRTNKILTVPQYSLANIKFLEELGEGAFGKVYKGKLTRENDTILVAVKALKENASPKTQLDFKREIELISELNHQNIVCILGVVLREEPLCMLFEFMALGDLHEFLVGRAPPGGQCLAPTQLLAISHHIACGMEYLAAHHYVHRDLAARNCLVAENLVVKISDFGLSRDIYSSDYYRVQSKSLLPIRWMPPESILYGKFTSESDVWSYGVVLWEIYSYGLQPYYGYSNQEVISMVRGRELLKCPQDCPRALYNLMKECWNQTPARRPNFSTISIRLNEWINSNIGIHPDNSSESSGAHSGQRAPTLGGDPRERIPLISHHSSSNGSLTGSIPRKLSTAGSIRSHASTRLMVSSSDVTSGSDNCEMGNHKKSSCGSLLEGQPSNIHSDRQRDIKISMINQPYNI